MAAIEESMTCPWCLRPALKDRGCNFVVCGRTCTGFLVGGGCGRAWCFRCGKKLCGRMYDDSGALVDSNEDHNVGGGHNPSEDDPCDGPDYCPGGHNSHKRAV